MTAEHYSPSCPCCKQHALWQTVFATPCFSSHKNTSSTGGDVPVWGGYLRRRDPGPVLLSRPLVTPSCPTWSGGAAGPEWRQSGARESGTTPPQCLLDLGLSLTPTTLSLTVTLSRSLSQQQIKGATKPLCHRCALFISHYTPESANK